MVVKVENESSSLESCCVTAHFRMVVKENFLEIRQCLRCGTAHFRMVVKGAELLNKINHG